MRRALQISLESVFSASPSPACSPHPEVFGQTAAVCPSPGAAGTVLGYPACVYGFFMYLIVAGTARGRPRCRASSPLVEKQRRRLGRDRRSGALRSGLG